VWFTAGCHSVAADNLKREESMALPFLFYDYT
jgi:hypothetical protein